MTARALLLALLCAACGSTSTPAPREPSSIDRAPWSRAGRRARVRHAWRCIGQQPINGAAGAPVSAGGGAVARPAPQPAPGPDAPRDCSYLTFLCAEIAKGHHAWHVERDACAALREE